MPLMNSWTLLSMSAYVSNSLLLREVSDTPGALSGLGICLLSKNLTMSPLGANFICEITVELDLAKPTGIMS
jgi:hypothetical protein